jgi:hypothetical protein
MTDLCVTSAENGSRFVCLDSYDCEDLLVDLGAGFDEGGMYHDGPPPVTDDDYFENGLTGEGGYRQK